MNQDQFDDVDRRIKAGESVTAIERHLYNHARQQRHIRNPLLEQPSSPHMRMGMGAEVVANRSSVEQGKG